jgi:hypothetical protein
MWLLVNMHRLFCFAFNLRFLKRRRLRSLPGKLLRVFQRLVWAMGFDRNLFFHVHLETGHWWMIHFHRFLNFPSLPDDQRLSPAAKHVHWRNVTFSCS